MSDHSYEKVFILESFFLRESLIWTKTVYNDLYNWLYRLIDLAIVAFNDRMV